MTLKLMRRPPPIAFSSSLSRPHNASAVRFVSTQLACLQARPAYARKAICVKLPSYRRFSNLSRRCLAHVRDERDIVWFTSTQPLNLPYEDNPRPGEHRQPDERTLKLGKTIQTLHTLLPNLLTTPLPQEILSPQISLHLFPSTHPHLPTVSGKIAYNAALWTAPVAWGRVPVVGNVKLIILSERMVKNGSSGGGGQMASNWTFTPDNTNNISTSNEKLIVKWRTSGKSRPLRLHRLPLLPRNQVDKITEFLGTSGQREANTSAEFEGLFIFEFDAEGRIVKHVIEHALEGRNWEGMPRVISVTDWLLGLARGRQGREEQVEEGAGLAWSEGCCGDADGEGREGQRGGEGGRGRSLEYCRNR